MSSMAARTYHPSDQSFRVDGERYTRPMPWTDDFSNELGRQIRGRVAIDAMTRALYSTDASIYEIMPIGVVIPRTPEDIFAAMEVAAEFEEANPGVTVEVTAYQNEELQRTLIPNQLRTGSGLDLYQQWGAGELAAPSSAATPRTTMSVTLAPRARISVKAS